MISEQDYQAMRARLERNGVPIPAEDEPRAKVAVLRGMNKLETEYAAKLEIEKRAGYILHWAFEPLHFRLAQGASYKPDFMVMHKTGEVQFVETKGFWRESARVRIKVAAECQPFRFIAVRKKKVSEGGGWEYEPFPGLVDRL